MLNDLSAHARSGHLRRILITFVVVGICTFAPSALPQVARDWERHPAIVQINTSEDIFVVGDVHGDYDRLVKVLRTAGIIEDTPFKPEKVKWQAQQAVLVFTGDLIDKGKHSLKVIALIRTLQDKAVKKGGQVVVLMGNHEAEFLDEPGKNKVQDFAGELEDEGFDPDEVAACEGDLGEFLCALPFGARVNAEWFFSHAGNTHGRQLGQLIADLRGGVNGERFHTPELVGKKSILRARLGKKPWFKSDDQSEKEVLADYAAKLGVLHMVQGHEPGKVKFAGDTYREPGTLFQRYGLLFLVDGGMSEAVNKSKGAVLHIKTKKAHETVVICPNGKRTVIWDDQTKPEIGKAAPCR